MSRSLRACQLRLSSTFSHAKRGSFLQEQPKLTNQYDEDPFMKEQLAIEIPKEVNNIIIKLNFYEKKTIIRI